MVGRTTLAVMKGLLTRHCHKLQETAKKCETPIKQNSENDDKDFLQIQMTEAELQATIELALNSLSKLAEVVDELDTITEEQEKEVQEYLDRAQTTIDHAESLKIELGSLKVSYERNDTRSSETIPSTSTKNEVSRQALPAIPIPTFTGDIWDFENFWRLFQANVDNQNLTKLQKFNYLINALKGEARELLRRFIVTEDNYDSAVAMLHRKYGDKSRLISKLQQRLEKTRAENSTLESQRRLLEEIIPLVSQLEAHGVHLGGSYASRKVLSKFSPGLQRKVLQHHLTPGMEEEEWSMTDTISALDECISMEERINEMIAFDEAERTVSEVRKDRVASTRYPDDDRTACMFCGSTNHKTAMCTRFSSIPDRRRFFQESERCLNCGKPGHFVRNCKSAGCRTCLGQKHHHTLCPKRHETQEGSHSNHSPTQTTTVNPQPSPPRKTKEYAPKEPKARTHVVKAEDTQRMSARETATEVDSRTVLHSQEAEQKKAEKVLLLTGAAKIWNNNEKKWIEVKILFDTGADQSFIGTDLAQRIGADCTQTQRLQMYTFGAKEPKIVECGVTHVKVSDLQEKEHTLRLFATPAVTEKGRRTSLCAQDQAFIREHGIALSRPEQIGDFIPEILLGCDQLWNFLENLSPQYKLPSGLLLIPSKFGYLLTGKQQRPMDVSERTLGVSDTSVAMVQGIANFEAVFEDDRDRWDKHRTMDSAGMCEFTGTKVVNDVLKSYRIEECSTSVEPMVDVDLNNITTSTTISPPNGAITEKRSQLPSLYDKYVIQQKEMETLEEQNAEYREKLLKTIREHDLNYELLRSVRETHKKETTEYEKRIRDYEIQLKTVQDKAFAQEDYNLTIKDLPLKYNSLVSQLTKKADIAEKEKNDAVIKYATREAEMIRMRTEVQKKEQQIQENHHQLFLETQIQESRRQHESQELSKLQQELEHRFEANSEIARVSETNREVNGRLEEVTRENFMLKKLQDLEDKLTLEKETHAVANIELSRLHIENQVFSTKNVVERAKADQEKTKKDREIAEQGAEECRKQAERMLTIIEQLTQRNSQFATDVSADREKNCRFEQQLIDDGSLRRALLKLAERKKDPEEARALRTRREAEEVIQSSCRITELFWKAWQQYNLTSLREKQLKNISRKRLVQEIPTVGSVVISNPILPRNSWKLGRITKVRRGSDGAIREVELLISNRRKIRRPLNFLIPLEIDEEATPRAVEEISSTQNELEKEQGLKPYDLRPRQQGCYVKNVLMTSRKESLRNSRTKWFLFYIMVLACTIV